MNVLSSLTNRIFFASALLVVVTMVVAVYRLNVAVTAQAQRELRVGLHEAASLVQEHKGAQFDNFIRLGRLVADLPKLKAAALEDDPPTVQPIAEDYEKQINADLFVVTNPAGRVLARAGRVTPPVIDLDRMLAAHRSADSSTWFWPYDDGVLQIAAIPMVIDPLPGRVGTLIVGFSLDRAAAERFKSLTGDSDIVVVMGNRIVASTLDANRTALLADVGSLRGEFDRRLLNEDFVGLAEPLGANVSDPDAPVALVLRSRTEHLRFLRDFYRDIAVTGVAAVLVATLLGYFIARTVTRPLRAVAATMREMAATGDLTTAPPGPGRWDDEDARTVASAFQNLTAALDRFQREASQRERLSSLGRLSTVVAHEVRNPLMIIKSAVRNLRKQASPEVVDVASSIDEEVTRLNRVVTDVLDFARPIRYQIEPADLVAICRDAAQATQVAPESVPVTVETGASAAAPVVTDVERVRAVLVNLLTNAQIAVRAAGAIGGAPPIRLRVSRAGTDRWAIDVIDRGPGIAPADLSHVFEPFFTTSRNGSGLGLALARNVVEGLGGAIAIDSRQNVGTTVRITLPETSRPAETHS